MSADRMRTLEEAPWIGLLPNDERAALEGVEADPEADEWAALVTADRTLEDDLSHPGRSARWLVPLAAGGLLAAILLALDPAGVADGGREAGGSTATASGEVEAVSAVPERNRVALGSVVASSSGEAAAETGVKPDAGGGSPSKPKKPGDGGGGGSETPPGSTPPPGGGQISIPGVQVPSVEVPPVTVPPVQLPPVQLPPTSLPPVQTPPIQVPLPQLPPLLPPGGQ